MPDPYLRERIENWVSDFCTSDRAAEFPPGVREYAADTLTHFLRGACDARGVPPEEIEEADVKAGLMGLARLSFPPTLRPQIPDLCGDFLTALQDEGRLGGGRVLGAYARALATPFLEAASGKQKPDRRPGSRIGRNDPCPCGSGKKYKKCCMRE